MKKQTELSKKLKAWQKRMGFDTMREASASLDVPYRTFQDWKNGVQKPRGLAYRLLIQLLEK